jgi:serine/threonine protein kinase
VTPLRCNDAELRDLCVGEPELHDVARGAVGVRLVRFLGAGGMSAVMLGEVDPARSPGGTAPFPRRIAVKILKPAFVADLWQEGVDARALADREAAVLGRITAREPPTDVIVGFHGRGDVLVHMNGREQELPWLALEFVDGGPDGASLGQRVARASLGCDPVRVHRLARRIAEGVAILHEEGVVHRDLKPDNVLVTGPVGDETPKIADCGIARYEGAPTTVAAFTREYAAPEQWLSRPGTRNPLVGPWTDVHALAAVVWFLVAGEHWCRGPTDHDFLKDGVRRSLRAGARLHTGFAAERTLLDALDAALAHGASPSLPEHLGAAATTHLTKGGPPRCASVAELMGHVLPLLEDFERRWRARAAREGVASTIIRTSQAPGPGEMTTIQPLAELVERPRIPPKDGPLTPLEAGNVAFQPDGRALARFGDRLYSLWGEGHTRMSVAPAEAPRLAATRQVARLPYGGFALVGPAHIRIVRPGRWSSAPLPARPGGGAVGEIVAALGDAHAFGVVTADVGEGGPELWLLRDATRWAEPLPLPNLDRVHGAVSTPYGFMAVGETTSPHGPRARAVFTNEGGQPSVYVRGLQGHLPLRVVVSSADRVAWAAGDDGVFALDPGGVAAEKTEKPGPPVAMGLDPVGIPWLVTARGVMRRSSHGAGATWELYHELDPGEPALVGIGFSGAGAWIVDAAGGGVLLRPRDVGAWGST